jgi:hypothetical protein
MTAESRGSGSDLDDRGVGVRVSGGSRIVTFHLVHTDCTANPVSSPAGKGKYYPSVDQLGREAGQLPYN